MGNSHLHITGTPEAQVWFDQGLNLLHDFWDYEAARAFEQGIRVDPRCGMCFWGLHQALIFRSNDATLDSEQALAAAAWASSDPGTRGREHAETYQQRQPDRAGLQPAASER